MISNRLALGFDGSAPDFAIRAFHAIWPNLREGLATGVLPQQGVARLLGDPSPSTFMLRSIAKASQAYLSARASLKITVEIVVTDAGKKCAATIPKFPPLRYRIVVKGRHFRSIEVGKFFHCLEKAYGRCRHVFKVAIERAWMTVEAGLGIGRTELFVPVMLDGQANHSHRERSSPRA